MFRLRSHTCSFLIEGPVPISFIVVVSDVLNSPANGCAALYFWVNEMTLIICKKMDE